MSETLIRGLLSELVGLLAILAQDCRFSWWHFLGGAGRTLAPTYPRTCTDIPSAARARISANMFSVALTVEQRPLETEGGSSQSPPTPKPSCPQPRRPPTRDRHRLLSPRGSMANRSPPAVAATSGSGSPSRCPPSRCPRPTSHPAHRGSRTAYRLQIGRAHV